MGRAKTKKTRGRATPTKDDKRAATLNDSGGSEVEKHWREYWAGR